MELFKMVLSSEVKKLHKNNVKLRVIGDTSRFDKKLVEQIKDAETLTANNDGLILNIAANYGGRWDILNATKALAEQVKEGSLESEQIDEHSRSIQYEWNQEVYENSRRTQHALDTENETTLPVVEIVADDNKHAYECAFVPQRRGEPNATPSNRFIIPDKVVEQSHT